MRTILLMHNFQGVFVFISAYVAWTTDPIEAFVEEFCLT